MEHALAETRVAMDASMECDKELGLKTGEIRGKEDQIRSLTDTVENLTSERDRGRKNCGTYNRPWTRLIKRRKFLKLKKKTF